MLKLIVLFLSILITVSSPGQSRHPIYALEARLMNGDKNALFEVASYFDSKKKITEFLGWHVLPTMEASIARRIVEENCLFTDSELRKSDDFVSAKKFRAFLQLNKEKIIFSKLANAFLITPLEEREANAVFRELSKTKKEELQYKAPELSGSDWVVENRIDSLIAAKDPLVLLNIVSALFKERNRFNRYSYNEKELIDLLNILTGLEIGVENEKKEISWHIDKDYYPDSKLNLLIYFSKFYAQYVWNEAGSEFKNFNNHIEQIGKEELLFELLNNENDSIALNAFTQLTTCNPAKVVQLADEYEKADIKRNYTIPIFPYRFLKQLVRLTEYCRTNSIDYIGSADLSGDIKTLQTKLSFTERYKLENKLIHSLSPDDITVLEYWSLIYQQSGPLTSSAGRILDIFYSKNWNKILNNKKQLDWYLKKSKLFEQLGIIGICNNYMRKFFKFLTVDFGNFKKIFRSRC